MTVNAVPTSRPDRLSPRRAIVAPRALPPWWSGSEEEFRLIYDARCEIHERDRIMSRKAWIMMIGSLLSVLSIYHLDAAGAVAGRGSPGLLATCLMLMVLTTVWILDRRLAQQLRDVRLQALVWNELVATVKQGWVDLSMVGTAHVFETDIERLLREELKQVKKFLAAEGHFELHLPLLTDCVALTRR